MKTSVCIFSDENDAKKILQELRTKHLGASLLTKIAQLPSRKELMLHTISAERPEHPIVLDVVADAESLQNSIIRCPHCDSARLDIPIGGEFNSTTKIYHVLTTKLRNTLGIAGAERSDQIVCRDCAGVVTLDDNSSFEPDHADSFVEPIAA